MSLEQIKIRLCQLATTRTDLAFTIHSYRSGAWTMVGSFISPIETAETYHSYCVTGRWGDCLEVRMNGLRVDFNATPSVSR